MGNSLTCSDRVSEYNDPSSFQEQEAPLRVDVGGYDQDDGAEQIRNQVLHGRGRRYLEMQERESSHIERSPDELGDDFGSHGETLTRAFRQTPPRARGR